MIYIMKSKFASHKFIVTKYDIQPWNSLQDTRGILEIYEKVL